MRSMDPLDGELGLSAVSTSARTRTPRKSRAPSLLIISSSSGSITPEIEAKIRKRFETSLIVEFDPKMDLEPLLTPTATVVVAGGDGTVGWVVRRLVDTKHPLGIISMGTFNNFAKSLRLPSTLDAAVRVIQEGAPSPITLGRINGKVFLEAAAIGLFGQSIAAGDAAKERAFGAFAKSAKEVIAARPFTYELTGDIKGSGSAMSLVFTNTPSTGAQLPVSDKTPVDPYLELSVHAGSSRADLVKRVLARTLLSKTEEHGLGQMFQFRELHITTRPRAEIYADNVRLGRTPASITAELSTLRVIMPR
jgi:diacylglycerol kinase (ATP)